MTQITVDNKLAEQLRTVGSEIEICSPEGDVIGRFRSEQLRRLHADSKCPISLDELQRRNCEEGGRTLDEIVRDLEAGK